MSKWDHIHAIEQKREDERESCLPERKELYRRLYQVLGDLIYKEAILIDPDTEETIDPHSLLITPKIWGFDTEILEMIVLQETDCIKKNDIVLFRITGKEEE